MTDIEHDSLGGNVKQHAIHRWAHADQTARYAQSVTSADVGKVSKQADTNTFWALIDHTNVANSAGWQALGSTGASPQLVGLWGALAAPGATASRYVSRLGAWGTSSNGAEFPAPSTGTRTYTLTWRVSGTALATDSVAIAIMKNGVLVGTTLLTIPAGATATGGQASLSITTAVGDGLCVRAVQSSTEAQAAWNVNFSLFAN